MKRPDQVDFGGGDRIRPEGGRQHRRQVHDRVNGVGGKDLRDLIALREIAPGNSSMRAGVEGDRQNLVPSGSEPRSESRSNLATRAGNENQGVAARAAQPRGSSYSPNSFPTGSANTANAPIPDPIWVRGVRIRPPEA